MAFLFSSISFSYKCIILGDSSKELHFLMIRFTVMDLSAVFSSNLYNKIKDGDSMLNREVEQQLIKTINEQLNPAFIL